MAVERNVLVFVGCKFLRFDLMCNKVGLFMLLMKSYVCEFSSSKLVFIPYVGLALFEV